MDGVSILNTYEVHTLIWLGIITAMVVLLAIYAIVEVYKDPDFNGTNFFDKIILFSFLAIFSYNSIASFATTETRLKATIDDDVKYKELTERYEVIEREGDIYTLVEKESEGT